MFMSGLSFYIFLFANLTTLEEFFLKVFDIFKAVCLTGSVAVLVQEKNSINPQSDQRGKYAGRGKLYL